MPAEQRDRSRSNQRQRQTSMFENLNDDVTEHEIINNGINGPSLNSRYVPPKGKKPPPITVTNISIMDLRNQLSLVKDIDQQKLLIKLTQHGIKIFCQNNIEFKILKEFCIRNEINHYTHTLHDERRIKICLYGLFKMNIETLKNELLTLHKKKSKN